MVWGTFLAVQDVNSIHNQPVTRVRSRLHVDTSTVLLQTPVSPLIAAACPAAGWLDVLSRWRCFLCLTFCPLGHYCPYTINPGGGWARDFPCCVHCQAPVRRKIPAEKWEYNSGVLGARWPRAPGHLWQRLPTGKNALRASGLLLALSVAAGCTGALLWELNPSSAPPCLFGSVL